MNKEKVMIAGIGGASLGTEMAKCLRLAGRYYVHGCDISETAYGLYSADFDQTFRVEKENYVGNVINACHASNSRWLIPGGEQPLRLLSSAMDLLSGNGIHLVANDSSIVNVFSEKQMTFEKLKELGFCIPKTEPADKNNALASIGFPCIIKPSIDSGGSVFVFLAQDINEAEVYIHYLRVNGYKPLIQEYIDCTEGEFTIGVLSLPDKTVYGSIALRRSLDAKLSLMHRGPAGIISSGYSQGYIGNFPKLQHTAEAIAKAISSRGPINIQGRVRDGELYPFEINPRFSASTYLRALAGFNEIDILLHYLISGKIPKKINIRCGWYLRSLTEQHVNEKALK
jgi:carbamoyl-phosphate synthase large subunit